jgi:hypothetical protein
LNVFDVGDPPEHSMEHLLPEVSDFLRRIQGEMANAVTPARGREMRDELIDLLNSIPHVSRRNPNYRSYQWVRAELEGLVHQWRRVLDASGFQGNVGEILTAMRISGFRTKGAKIRGGGQSGSFLQFDEWVLENHPVRRMTGQDFERRLNEVIEQQLEARTRFLESHWSREQRDVSRIARSVRDAEADLVFEDAQGRLSWGEVKNVSAVDEDLISNLLKKRDRLATLAEVMEIDPPPRYHLFVPQGITLGAAERLRRDWPELEIHGPCLEPTGNCPLAPVSSP